MTYPAALYSPYNGYGAGLTFCDDLRMVQRSMFVGAWINPLAPGVNALPAPGMLPGYYGGRRIAVGHNLEQRVLEGRTPFGPNECGILDPKLLLCDSMGIAKPALTPYQKTMMNHGAALTADYSGMFLPA